MKVLEKAEREIQEGRLWRARDILKGSITHSVYNPEVLEKLGLVLLRMGDLPDAGKYLFLSGSRKSEYDEAIEVFLRKYPQPDKLFRTFPRSAKMRRFSEYPPQLADDLKSLGFEEPLKEEDKGVVSPNSGSEMTPLLIVFSILLGIVILLILGIVKLVEIIF